jgi:hypothetical protein
VSASELVLIVAAVLCSIGFAALVVVLLRVLDTLRDVRREVDQLRMETTLDEARADLERFDRVLGSAEAIGDAVGGRVARTTFSAPMIKATSFARGTSRTIARLRGGPRRTSIAPVEVRALEHPVARPAASPTRWRKRA